MTKHRIIPAIMSGGSGTRLWPSSTDAKPKQFHALMGEDPLIVQTVARVRGETGALCFAPPMILCNAGHCDLAVGQLTASGNAPSAVVLEPMGRNTAATAAIAAALAVETDPGALVLLLPADHVVSDGAAFLEAIERAAPLAHERIVTFGIEPSWASEAYGYIKRGAELAPGVYEVDAFKEKPKGALAQSYLDDGGYSWNAGMFFFHPRVLLEEFDAAPDIRKHALDALAHARRDGALIHLDAARFEQTPSLPLDIAVMQETKRAAVAPCDIGWADIGSWDEILRLSPRDAQGNAISGAAGALDASNNLLRSEGPKILAAGVSDLIIVATADAVVVLPRDRAQDVKLLRELAEKLRS